MKDVNNQRRDNEKQKMKETCKEQQKKDTESSKGNRSDSEMVRTK